MMSRGVTWDSRVCQWRRDKRQSRQRDSRHRDESWGDVLGIVRTLLWPECMWNERGRKTRQERKIADKCQR